MANTPRVPQIVFDLAVPVLGICYGQQAMCQQLGGRVEPGTSREFGRAELQITERSHCLKEFGMITLSITPSG